jgi:hypothetical protein
MSSVRGQAGFLAAGHGTQRLRLPGQRGDDVAGGQQVHVAGQVLDHRHLLEAERPGHDPALQRQLSRVS